MNPLRSKIDDVGEAALDQTPAYLQDEYSLVLGDLVRERAKRLVIELLKGNHEVARFFCLEKTVWSWGIDVGKDFVYDPDGVRRAIVEGFKAEIQTAEMIALREENAQLREQSKWYRESRG